jgi:ATP-dependent Clp endopeptidase proteolytic subunit ClpP
LNFKKQGQPFEIRNKTAVSAELVIYGSIGHSFFEDGITAKMVSDALKDLDPTVKDIVVRVNSPGGCVFEGVAIYNRLKQHKAKVTVYVDGLAASIASIIALAGDEVIMGEGALYMIHLPWTWAAGNRNDLDNTINRLLDVEEQLISIYAKKSKMDRSEIKSLLEKETWMDATQAMELGFVDKTMDESLPIAASALEKTWFNKVPKSVKTEDVVAREKVTELRNKVSAFLTRK